MNSHFYAVIMAGGGGTRLWPLSRQSKPKQMLKLIGERTLFQVAIDRLQGLFPPERIMIVTVADQAPALQALCPNIPAENYLLEPLPRGTASVVGLAALALRARDPQAIMAILTADHFIENEAMFRSLLQAGCMVAEQGHLVTLGITPTYPATGYGYIQRGEFLGEFAGQPAYRVLRFKEKPDEDQAREMLEHGDHDWNSGMFLWQVDRIWGEFQRQMPNLYEQLSQIAASWGTPGQVDVLAAIWPTIKPETIDYGIMERAQDVMVLPAQGLGWNDVGSWDALYDVTSADERGNIVLDGSHLGLDTQRALVCGPEGQQRLIVTIGVQDLIIIDTQDALLVCHRDQAQQVKEVVNQLKREQRSQYL